MNGILYVADGSAGVITLSLADCMVVFSDGFESGDLSAAGTTRVTGSGVGVVVLPAPVPDPGPAASRLPPASRKRARRDREIFTG